MSDGRPFRRAGTGRRGGIICIADHASNHVPEDVELGLPSALMQQHIALDIGVEGVADRLARRHGIAAHVATISRLVCDLHREEDDPACVPTMSDGHLIPGNIGADVERRLATYYRPYHAALAEWVSECEPELIVAVHSFTPELRSSGEPRPWQVGLLYNDDDRASRHAIRLFAEEGLTVGDNQPYSGKDLNVTMNRHAEARGIPYLTVEIRQDQITDEAGQARWAALLADVANRVALALQ